MNFNEQYIEQFLNHKFSQLQDGEYIGLRMLPNKKDGSLKIQSGLYNNMVILIQHIKELAGQYNLYICMNPLKFNDKLAINSYRPNDSFGDSDVTRYTTFYVDIDPKRAAGCASTEEETQAAYSVAKAIAEFLTEKNIQCYSYFSGNGFSLLVNLPSYNIQQKDNISKLLNYLNSEFSTELAKVDTSVSNPSRIMRCIGTLNMKGESTIDRPHRLAMPLCDYTHELSTYDILEIFKEEISEYMPLSSSKSISKIHPPQSDPNLDYSKFKNNIMTLDLVTLVKKMGLYVKQLESNMHIVLCPNRKEHSDDTDGTNSTVIFQDVFPPKIAFKCHHNHCEHINLKYFLNTYCDPQEVDSLCSLPFIDLRNHTHSEVQHLDKPFLRSGFNVRKIYEIISTPSPEYHYVVEDLLLAGGLTFIAAQPKVGKTTLIRHLCKAVAHGESFLDKKTTKGPVVYLALEEHIEEMKKEFIKLGVQPDTNLYIHAEPAPPEGVQQLIPILESYKPILLIVDTMQKLIKLSDLNDYAKVNNALEPILSLARKYNCNIVLTHHMNKVIDGDNGRKILGSTAIFGACDAVIFLEKKNDERVLSVEYRYSPAEPINKSVLYLNPDNSELSLREVKEQKKQSLNNELLSLIGQYPELSKEELLERAGKRKAEVIKALDRLTSAGYLDKTGSGKRGSPVKFKVSNLVPNLDIKNGNEILDVEDNI